MTKKSTAPVGTKIYEDSIKMSSIIIDTHDDRAVSSKRVVALASFTLCSVAFIANLVLDYAVEQYMFETMAWISISGLGLTAMEKFTKQ